MIFFFTALGIASSKQEDNYPLKSLSMLEQELIVNCVVDD